MKKLVIIPAAIIAMSFAACGDEAVKDASQSGQTVDRSPAHVIAMPDEFSNIATKCDGKGHRVFSNGDDIFAINDSNCR